MNKYAGQQLTTGAQAETYADHFIANHLKAIGGGKTYAQLAAQAQADPTNTKLAATVDTMFKGETLRGLLLNAYAFGTMATIAGIAAIAAFIGSGVMLMLSLSVLSTVAAATIPPSSTSLSSTKRPRGEPVDLEQRMTATGLDPGRPAPRTRASRSH